MAVSLGATIQPTTGPSVAGSTGIFLPHLAHRFLIFMGSSLLLLEFFLGWGSRAGYRSHVAHKGVCGHSQDSATLAGT